MIRADAAREELVKKLETLRKRVTELEALEADRKQAKLKITDNERPYGLVTENPTDVIWKVNIDNPGRLSYISPSVTHLLGYTVEEAMAKTMEEVFTPASFKIMKALAKEMPRVYKERSDKHRSRTLELELKHKDGFVVAVEANYSLIHGNAGQPVEILAVARDITERKRTEAQLRQSEAKYSTLVEKGNDGVVIIQDGLLKFANSRMIDIAGSPMQEVIGRSFLDFVSPEYRALVVDKYKKRISGEKTASRYEIEILPKEGRRMPVEISGSFIEHEGRPADMVVIRDITERKKAERQQREIEEELKTYLENAPDGVYLSDLKGVLLYGNKKAEKILGYKKEDLIGSTFLKMNLLPAQYLIKAGKLLALSAMGLNTGPDEFELIKSDKNRVWVEINTAPIRQKHKKVVIGFVRDITERKKTEEALKASEQNFRNSISSSSMGIRIGDVGEQTFYLNQAFLDIFGYENIEEVKTSPPTDYYTPESYTDFVLRKEKLLRGETIPEEIEVDIVRKDGNIRHLQICRKDIFWNGKRESQIVYNDITERKQMEEELKASEQNFRNSMDNSFMGIRIMGDNDYTLYANQTLLDIFGYKDIEELRASPPQEHYTPESYAGFVQRKEQFSRGESLPDQLEFDIIRKDGAIRHLQLFSKNVLWNSKQQHQFLYNDITDHKNAEQALRASEQNFRNSLDTSPIGIQIVNMDWDTLYVNQIFLNIFGYENIDEVKASPPNEHLATESYPSYVMNSKRILHNEPVPNQIEISIIRKDGNIRYLQVFRKEVLWDGKQQYQLIYNDITEQKQAQLRLEQAAQEWRTTFDSISDLISIHDKDNRIIRVNKAMADMLKTTPQELVGKFCHEVMHGTKEPPATCPHLQTLTTGKPTALETFDPNLGVHFYEASSPILNEKGEITGSVIVARDVTKQKRMEEQLIMTDRLASIGELSSGIAHELNNPLTSVIGFSQLMMEGDVPANIKENLGIVYSEAHRAAAIVKNLLTFARKHAPVKQLSQVNTVIEDVLRLRAYEQKVNNIEVETHLAPNLPEIMIDNFQMQQVFLNIIVNAESAMLEAHHRGKLVITTENSDGVIRITLTDDGPGITKENLKRIFDPFFTTKEVGKGTGLGLSICHGIVTEHSGQIYAISEKDQGATFVVELPLNAQ